MARPVLPDYLAKALGDAKQALCSDDQRNYYLARRALRHLVNAVDQYAGEDAAPLAEPGQVWVVLTLPEDPWSGKPGDLEILDATTGSRSVPMTATGEVGSPARAAARATWSAAPPSIQAVPSPGWTATSREMLPMTPSVPGAIPSSWPRIRSPGRRGRRGGAGTASALAG
jgi:hypothetical protein